MVKSDQKIPVIELFGPTIQGEGAMAGVQTTFLRTGGCDFRCTMCDSMHAVDSKEIQQRARYLTQGQILDELMGIQSTTPWVTFSGGNPCLWDLGEVVRYLHNNDVKVAVETQGTYWQDWVFHCNQVTISPKGPGMGEKCDWEVLAKFIDRLDFRASGVCLKVVCFGEQDIDLAEKLHEAWPKLPFYLSVGNVWLPGTPLVPDAHKLGLLRLYKWLCEAALKRPSLSNAVVLPQLHVLTWGNELEK